jgi:hypothetical protein
MTPDRFAQAPLTSKLISIAKIGLTIDFCVLQSLLNQGKGFKSEAAAKKSACSVLLPRFFPASID